jgi:hypothetical protein
MWDVREKIADCGLRIADCRGHREIQLAAGSKQQAVWLMTRLEISKLVKQMKWLLFTVYCLLLTA